MDCLFRFRMTDDDGFVDFWSSLYQLSFEADQIRVIKFQPSVTHFQMVVGAVGFENEPLPPGDGAPYSCFGSRPK